MGDSLASIDLGGSGTVVALTAGGYHTCALFSNGVVKCWGSGVGGQLASGGTDHIGDGANEMGSNLGSVDLGSVTVSGLAAGGYHTCALLSGGAVRCWGENGNGQLGQGHVNSLGDGAGEVASLANISLGSNLSARLAVGGGSHTCALLSGQTNAVKCWGNGADGQLGQGNTDDLGNAANELGNVLSLISF